jgi:CBS domain-containing protein
MLLLLSRIGFAELVDRPIRNASGNQIGKIADLIARLLDGGLPQLTGLVRRIEGREVFVPMTEVSELTGDGIRLASNRQDTRPFERRPGEVLLGRDVVGRAVIDLVEGRLVRVADLILSRSDATWHVTAVVAETAWSPGRALGRLLGRETAAEEIAWERIEPLTGHVPTAARRLPLPRLARMKPADIADIVEQASHEEGQEILESVHQDRELEADVFEELDDEHQVEFIKDRSDSEVAALLADMEPDDAADLLTKLDRDRRRPILEKLPEAEQAQVRRLLGYNPQTAGGLMGTEFVALPETLTVAEALNYIRRSDVPDDLAVVYTVAGDRLTGAVTLANLVRAEPQAVLRDLVGSHPVAVFPDADVPSVAVEMADYNLASLPVVDEEGRILGVVTYDDLVEAIIPEEWRWRGEANEEHRYQGPVGQEAAKTGQVEAPAQR